MEPWTYGLFFLAVAGALALVSDRTRPLAWPLWIILATAVILTAVGALDRRAEGDYSALGYIAQQAPTGGYVTSAACRSCHPGEYRSWHKTWHRTMTQVVTPETVAAPFAGEVYQLDDERHAYHRRGDELFHDIDTLDADGEVIASESRLVVMSTGSHHLQIYWDAAPDGGEPIEGQIYWSIDEDRWIPKRDTLLQRPSVRHAPGRWILRCIRCHSVDGNPGYIPNTSYFATRVAEFGIACEACHGPGEAHVARHKNPLRRYLDNALGAADSTIVNPADLPSGASAQVCGRCHASYLTDMQTYVVSGMGYQPGMDLERFVRFGRDTETENSLWPDGTSFIGGDEYNAFVLSGCASRGEMDCLSCHSMHDSPPSDMLARGMEGDRACLQCHGEVGRDVTAHTHHPADSPGSHCYNCHMPYTSWALSTAMRSHRVDRPVVDQSALNARPNACNLCHLDKTLAWTNARLADWYGTPATPLRPEAAATPASAVWLLSGNALQRALAAWHLGWKPAQQASGTGWQPPLLAALLDDPYSQVRFVAGKALHAQPGFADFDYDFLAPAAVRQSRRDAALKRWAEQANPRATLTAADGSPVDAARIRALQAERDDTPVDVPE